MASTVAASSMHVDLKVHEVCHPQFRLKQGVRHPTAQSQYSICIHHRDQFQAGSKRCVSLSISRMNPDLVLQTVSSPPRIFHSTRAPKVTVSSEKFATAFDHLSSNLHRHLGQAAASEHDRLLGVLLVARAGSCIGTRMRGKRAQTLTSKVMPNSVNVQRHTQAGLGSPIPANQCWTPAIRVRSVKALEVHRRWTHCYVLTQLPLTVDRNVLGTKLQSLLVRKHTMKKTEEAPRKPLHPV